MSPRYPGKLLPKRIHKNSFSYQSTSAIFLKETHLQNVCCVSSLLGFQSMCLLIALKHLNHRLYTNEVITVAFTSLDFVQTEVQNQTGKHFKIHLNINKLQLNQASKLHFSDSFLTKAVTHLLNNTGKSK